MKKTVLLGKGTLAIRIAEWFLKSPDHELVEIVPVVPEPKWTNSLTTWAEAHGVPYVASGSYRELRFFDTPGQTIDLAFSVFYDRIIKPTFIARCGRILNLHNGPLPRYRGVSPINWALKNNETCHGVTIHEMSAGIDDGPVVAQLTYAIYPEFDEVKDVYTRALAYGWTLFEQTMPLIDRIRARAQDHSLATYYSAKENELLGERRSFTRQESLGLLESLAGTR